MSETPLVSLVIPAFNEARRLPATLEAWTGFFGNQPYSAEVLVVDDGSQDNTAAIASSFSAKHPHVRLVRQPLNRGKGAAVRAGMLAARGKAAFYVDADLNISPDQLSIPLELLTGDACDVVVGQRSLSEYAGNERSMTRLIAGGLVQVTRRALVMRRFRDTQCGLKGFRQAMAREVFRRTLVDGFAFDIEVLFLAQRLGARIKTVTVTTEYRAGSSYIPSKHLAPFLRDIVRIRLSHLRGRYGSP